MTTWQLQQAKQHFSEVVRAAETGEPQIITKHGRQVAVVIEYEGYRRMLAPRRNFKAFLEQAPLGNEFEPPERAAETQREIEWA